MTDVINNNATLEEEYIEKFNVLSGKFDELKTYVETYFDNLDVQEEINNKLDQMAEDGQLADIISQYLNSTAVFGYDNVASMKAATNLVNGSYARTLGYYAKNDGGAGLYKIRYITNDDVVDEGSIIEITADPENRLIAELIVEDNTIDVKQFGAIGDGIADDTLAIQKALTFGIGRIVLISNGIYLISSSLSASGNEITGNAIIKASASFAGNEMLMPHNKVSIEGIKFDCNNYAICAIGDSDDCSSIDINNCEFTGTKRNVGEGNFAMNSCVYLTGKVVNMTNSKVYDNLSHGARLYPKVANSIANVDNCEFNNNGSTTEGSEVIACGLAHYGGGENGLLYDKVSVSNCYAVNNANTGLALHGCNNVTIDNCVSKENKEHGICLMDGKNGVISNCLCDTNKEFGIRIQGDYSTTAETWHGYKNCVITGNNIIGNGIYIDEDIENIEVTNNNCKYVNTGSTGTPKGLRIGRYDKLSSYVKKGTFVNNAFNDYSVFPIESMIMLDNSNTFNNYVDGIRTSNYKGLIEYLRFNSCSTTKYGVTDNVLNDPTNFSNWTMVSGATVSNNVITRGTDNFICFYRQKINSIPRFVSVSAKFSDYTANAKFEIGIRFRDSNNTLCSSDYKQEVQLQGTTLGEVFDLTKVTGLTPSRIDKVEIMFKLSTGSIKMDYCYCSLSDEMPILPNVLS
jgi:hypothetical protein